MRDHFMPTDYKMSKFVNRKLNELLSGETLTWEQFLLISWSKNSTLGYTHKRIEQKYLSGVVQGHPKCSYKKIGSK